MSRIAFITDVEGNYTYFERCVQESGLLFFDEDGSVNLAPGAKFVFGGDGGDKGNGTLRFYRAMVALKKRYPDRVVLIIGNRDANKLRFLSELDESDLHLDVPMPEGVTGDAKTFREHLRATIAPELGVAAAEVTDNQLLQHCTQTNKLKWILDSTMGAKGDFEFRRSELEILNGGKPVSNEEIVKSYIDSVREGGVVLEYLRLGQLGGIIDETLFVHGGIMGKFSSAHEQDSSLQSCVGYVPHQEARSENVRQWIQDLNEWCQQEIRSCTADPLWKENRTKRNGSGLLEYSAYCREPSVIMAKQLNRLSQPVELSPTVSQQLHAGGIGRVVCGHTPHGTCPSVIRNGDVEVFLCDTSYSDMSKPDNRGIAACAISIEGPVTKVAGVLPDGRRYSYITALPGTVNDEADEYVGRGKYDDFWVKAKLETPGEPQYLLCKVSGISYEYKDASLEQVKSL